MATIVAAAGGGNWTAGGTWVGGVAPTAADDAQLTGTSGNVTIDSGAVARSLDCTGYTGALTHGSSVTCTLGDGTAGAGNVALKLVAGMTYTTLTNASQFNMVSTSGTQQTITTAGKSMQSFFIGGTGGSYLLADSFTQGSAAASFNLVAGTFNTGNFAMSLGLLVISSATAKTLTLGSSAIAITGNSGSAVNVTGSNITYTANTAVMTLSGASAGISGGANWNGLDAVFTTAVAAAFLTSTALDNVTVNGPVSKVGRFQVGGSGVVVAGTLTVTGNSTTNRLIFQTTTAGTPITVTVTTGFSFANVDFTDITAAGAAGTWTGTSMGNALGNSNITFDPPATQTRTGAGGNASTAASWTSRVPLPQDNVIIGAAASGTITFDMPRLGADVDFTGFTGTAAFTSVANSIYGSINLASGMTITAAFTLTLGARSSKTITSNGKSYVQSVTITAPGGTYTLVDAFTTAASFTVSMGAFVSSNFAVTASQAFFQSTTGSTLGTSTVTLTSTGAVAVLTGAAGLSAASATFVVSTASANARSIVGGGQTYGTLTYTVPGSTGSLTITGSNTFGTVNFSDATNARSLLFTAGTTTTVTNWNVVGTAGKLMTVDTATAAQHSLVKAGGGVVSSDYLNVAHSDATPGTTWYAGVNSTNGGNDSGWIFTAPPVGGGTARRALLGVGA